MNKAGSELQLQIRMFPLPSPKRYYPILFLFITERCYNLVETVQMMQQHEFETVSDTSIM